MEVETRIGPKRKRAAMACFSCQKKKVKCDGQVPCRACSSQQLECVFAETRNRRGRQQSTTSNDEIEQRLRRMETILNATKTSTDGGPSRWEQSRQAGDNSNHKTSPPRALVDLTPSQDQNAGLMLGFRDITEDVGYQFPSGASHTSSNNDHGMGSHEAPFMHIDLPTHPATVTDYSTPSLNDDAPNDNSPFNTFSPFAANGIHWALQRLQDTNLKKALSAVVREETGRKCWRSDLLGPHPRRCVHVQLPPKEETTVLVDLFFRDFNNVVPLFSPTQFKALLEQQFTPQPPKEVGWWASLNVVIAMSLPLQSTKDRPSRTSGRDFLRNGLAVLAELIIHGDDPLAVPALLGLAMALQGTPDPRPAAALLVSAKRFIYNIGRYKGSGRQGNSPEVEQQGRLFWIACRLENDLAIRSGLPLCLGIEGLNVELPSQHPQDQLGCMSSRNGEQVFNIFRVMAEFSLIEAATQKELQLARASPPTDEEIDNIVTDLDHRLEKWKESIPDEFNPEYEPSYGDSQFTNVHILVMHLGYHNCVQAIHRLSQQHSYWTNPSSHVQPRDDGTMRTSPLSQSAVLIGFAARASLRLVRHIPTTESGYIWRVLYYPANAFIVLFMIVMQNPANSRVQSDLRLMRSFVNFLRRLTDSDGYEMEQTANICTVFEEIASEAVAKAKENNTQSQEAQNPPMQGNNSRNGVGLSDALAVNASQSLLPAGNQVNQDFSGTLSDADLLSSFVVQPYSGVIDSFMTESYCHQLFSLDGGA